MELPKIFSFILIIIAAGCIEPVSVEKRTRIPPIIVDGMITDSPGPYVVKIFYGSALGTTLRKQVPFTGANVSISDDAGNSEILVERSPGIYETSFNGIQGQIGGSYQLVFEKAGKKYESEFQKLRAPGVIDKLYTSFEQNLLEGSPNTSGPNPGFDALNIYVDARGVSDESTLLRWRTTGVYEMRAFPERHQKSTINGYIPDPLPCSGYVANGLNISKVSECECCQCWLYEYSSGVNISDNLNIHDAVFNKVNIGKIPITSMRFYTRYHLEVEQLSLSDDIYDFWKLVRIQENSSGNIFQPNAVKIRGNVKCVSDPNEEVLGIFSVSGVVRTSIFIDQAQIPYSIPAIDTLAADCRDFAFSSQVKPPFW
jgi:hypothetical protein